ARLEADGLLSHTASGGRKVYEITEAGRSELVDRADELADLESDIHASVADLSALAAEVEQGVRGSVRDLKRELREATRAVQSPRTEQWRHWREVWNSGGAPPARAGEPHREPPAGGGGVDEPGTDVERKAMGLAQEVRRLVRAGRATAEDLRAAGSVLDTVLGQLRQILRG